MKRLPRPFSGLPGRCARGLLLALLGAGMAWAQEHADISQLLKSGQAGQALARIEQRLAAQPRDVQLRFLLGVAQTDCGQRAQAIATFTALTEQYPELPEPYNNLAVLHAGQNRLDQARSLLEMALRANPDYATAQQNLGDVHARLAGRAWRQALALALALEPASAAALGPRLALIGQLFPGDGGGDNGGAGDSGKDDSGENSSDSRNRGGGSSSDSGDSSKPACPASGAAPAAP